VKLLNLRKSRNCECHDSILLLLLLLLLLLSSAAAAAASLFHYKVPKTAYGHR
jgi:hypothetical protein